ncbi:MAG: hypothetical protein ACHQNT_13095 [Bacteroidia bacterium]
MKNLIIIISAFIFFASCKKNECEDAEGNLTAEELSWLSYAGGESIEFKSNNNLRDTFYVGNKTNYDYLVSSSGCNAHQQSISCKIQNHATTSFVIWTKHKNEWSPEGKALIATSSDVFVFSDYSPQNNILINGNIYNNVYVMAVDTPAPNPKHIWRIYYTKQTGILRYDFTQGEQWEKIN